MAHEIVVARSSYTPRHLRRRGNSGRNGTVGPEKQRAFRAAAQLSKRFIHQSADSLEKPKLSAQYADYKRRCDNNALRAGK